jgi:hypothetical protein
LKKNEQDQKTFSQLEEIRREAKVATDEISSAFDAIFDACDALLNPSGDDDTAQEALMKIYGTGSVQDVLRQRMEKIARIAARIIDPTLPEDDALLSGPQSGERGMQQDDVNRLLDDFD